MTNPMNTCNRCGGKFPTRTSGIDRDATVCMSAAQCDANLAALAATLPPCPACGAALNLDPAATRETADGRRSVVAVVFCTGCEYVFDGGER